MVSKHPIYSHKERRIDTMANETLAIKDAGSGDRGLEEDAQNQIGFWMDDTTGGQAGSGGHEFVGGHDDVSSLHEDDDGHDAVDDPLAVPELVRR